MPLVAICLVGLMGFMALAIDIGILAVARNQAQNAADAVRLAIRRLQRHLAGAVETDGEPHLGLRALADHIEKYILIPSARRSASGTPGCFTYEPPPGVRWVHVAC